MGGRDVTVSKKMRISYSTCYRYGKVMWVAKVDDGWFVGRGRTKAMAKASVLKRLKNEFGAHGFDVEVT